MKFFQGKILIAAILTSFTNIVLAVGIETIELQHEAELKIVSANNDLSYVGWGVSEPGTILLLCLGLFGLFLARRQSA